MGCPPGGDSRPSCGSRNGVTCRVSAHPVSCPFLSPAQFAELHHLPCYFPEGGDYLCPDCVLPHRALITLLSASPFSVGRRSECRLARGDNPFLAFGLCPPGLKPGQAVVLHSSGLLASVPSSQTGPHLDSERTTSRLSRMLRNRRLGVKVCSLH